MNTTASNSAATQSSPYAFQFAAGGAIYGRLPTATLSDIEDHLSARLTQLCALLSNTTGHSYRAFHGLGEHVRDNYLWCCAMLAQECHELSTRLANTDRVQELLTLLMTRLDFTYGSEAGAFNRLDDEASDVYLGLCSSLAAQCRDVYSQPASRGGAD